MRRLLKFLGSLLGILALASLIVILGITFRGVQSERFGAPMFQSPLETPTPNRPFQTPSPIPSTTTPGLPTPPPSPVLFPTPIVPTPPTPIPNAPLISKERAINRAMNQSPRFVEMQKSGQLKVTAKLTVHGDIGSGTTGDLRYSPHLPVWIVYLHLPPWTETRGPVGKEVVVKFNAERFEIDATTGKVIGGGRSYVDETLFPTTTPEAAP